MCSRRRRSRHGAVAVAIHPGTTSDRGLDRDGPRVACLSPSQPLQDAQQTVLVLTLAAQFRDTNLPCKHNTPVQRAYV